MGRGDWLGACLLAGISKIQRIMTTLTHLDDSVGTADRHAGQTPLGVDTLVPRPQECGLLTVSS